MGTDRKGTDSTVAFLWRDRQPGLGGTRAVRSRPLTGFSDYGSGVNLEMPMFTQSPHLSDLVNGRIVHSEIEGGVHLGDLTPGTVLEIETENRAYTLEYQGLGQALISG